MDDTHPKRALEREFGGSWDGPRERMHGLISTDRGTLKVDLTQREGRFLCSVFADGECLASAGATTALEAVREALGDADIRDRAQTP
jgi:hypothetical protein